MKKCLNIQSPSYAHMLLRFLFISIISINCYGLNAQECSSPDWNDMANKALLTATTTVSTGGNGGIVVILDGVTGNNNFYYQDVAIANLEVLRVEFPSSEILTGLEYAIGDSYMFNTNAVIKIQGSDDATAWTDMVPVAENTSPSLVISGNELTKDRGLGNNHPGVISNATSTERVFWTNTTAYKYYRMLGVSGNTNQNPWVNELYFQTNDGFEVLNFSCNDNGTSEDFNDDQLIFDFAPLKGTGSYYVAVDGGFSISPTSGIYGQTTTFTLSAGSSGADDLNLTVTDANVPCVSTLLIPNSSNACEPGPCGTMDWNAPALKSTLVGDFHIPGTGSTDGPLAVLVDSNDGSGVGSKNNSYTNEASFIVEFPAPTVLQGMEVVINSSNNGPIVNGVMQVEGSTDGITYTPVSIVFTHGINLNIAAAQYTSATQAYTFPFTSNTTAYKFYRLFSTSMQTRFGRNFNELYFDYAFFDPKITNQTCDNNGTMEDYTDDKVVFELNPEPGAAGMPYSVEVDGGFTITPTTGTFGQVTTFTVSEGSSGAGDLNVSLYDSSEPCLQNILIPNSENACIPGPCGGPDWNSAAIKTTLNGDFHIPGTGATDGPLAVLVDSNNGSGVGSKNNSYTNEATFSVEFPEATVLHGMEVVINSTNNGPIVNGVMQVEGSNDGTTYMPVSIVYTHGTNLNVAAAQYGSGAAQAYTFPFSANTTAYKYYRLYSTSMQTRFGRNFNELYFDYDVYDANIDNISFGDNSTMGVFDDDVVNFELNPSPGSGSYSLQMTGYTITPSTGTYGQVSSFQISEGSAGTGDLTVLLLDSNVPCVQQILIANPDLSANVESSQAICVSPTDNPLGTITITAADTVYTKAEYNIGAAYNGTGFATATDLVMPSSGIDLVTNLVNPEYTTYYTVRGYVTETLYRDFVVSIEPKVCSVADLVVSVTPATADANEGEQLMYVVNLTNSGPDPAINVEVKVDIPPGLEILSSSPTIGDYTSGTQLWTADLVPVGTHQLSITYRMK